MLSFNSILLVYYGLSRTNWTDPEHLEVHNYVLLYDENNFYLFVGMNCECYDRNNPCGLLFIGVTVAEIYPTFSSFMNLSFSISFLEKKVFYGVAF